MREPSILERPFLPALTAGASISVWELDINPGELLNLTLEVSPLESSGACVALVAGDNLDVPSSAALLAANGRIFGPGTVESVWLEGREGRPSRLRVYYTRSGSSDATIRRTLTRHVPDWEG